MKFPPLYFPSLDEHIVSLKMATVFVVVLIVLAVVASLVVVVLTPLALVPLDQQTSPAKSITLTKANDSPIWR